MSPARFQIRSTISVVIIALLFLMVGCDFSARWDLRKAEKALKAADKANAEFWAEREYRKAQKYFSLAMDEARVKNINRGDAYHEMGYRDLAEEARIWADEAFFLAIMRAEEMEEEKDALSSKKY